MSVKEFTGAIYFWWKTFPHRGSTFWGCPRYKKTQEENRCLPLSFNYCWSVHPPYVCFHPSLTPEPSFFSLPMWTEDQWLLESSSQGQIRTAKVSSPSYQDLSPFSVKTAILWFTHTVASSTDFLITVLYLASISHFPSNTRKGSITIGPPKAIKYCMQY